MKPIKIATQRDSVLSTRGMKKKDKFFESEAGESHF